MSRFLGLWGWQAWIGRKHNTTFASPSPSPGLMTMGLTGLSSLHAFSFSRFFRCVGLQLTFVSGSASSSAVDPSFSTFSSFLALCNPVETNMCTKHIFCGRHWRDMKSYLNLILVFLELFNFFFSPYIKLTTMTCKHMRNDFYGSCSHTLITK